MRSDRPGELCVVEWDDITSVAGWTGEWSPEIEPARCVDVGWVIDRGDFVVLVRSLHPDQEDSGDAAAIPRGCIRSIIRVNEPGGEPTQP